MVSPSRSEPQHCGADGWRPRRRGSTGTVQIHADGSHGMLALRDGELAERRISGLHRIEASSMSAATRQVRPRRIGNREAAEDVAAASTGRGRAGRPRRPSSPVASPTIARIMLFGFDVAAMEAAEIVAPDAMRCRWSPECRSPGRPACGCRAVPGDRTRCWRSVSPGPRRSPGAAR